MNRRGFLRAFTGAIGSLALAPYLPPLDRSSELNGFTEMLVDGLDEWNRPVHEVFYLRISNSPLYSYGFTGFKPIDGVRIGGNVTARCNEELPNGHHARSIQIARNPHWI